MQEPHVRGLAVGPPGARRFENRYGNYRILGEASFWGVSHYEKGTFTLRSPPLAKRRSNIRKRWAGKRRKGGSRQCELASGGKLQASPWIRHAIHQHENIANRLVIKFRQHPDCQCAEWCSSNACLWVSARVYTKKPSCWIHRVYHGLQ